MYHFVKIANIWYLKVENKQDIIDHYNIILKREYEEGLKDRVSSTHFYKKDGVYIEHPTTAWAKAVEQYMAIWNLSWVMAAHKLETETINGRIQLFDRGCTIYLNDGLTYFSPKGNVEYNDECWKDELEYPEPDTYTVNDIRYIQWKDGSHWYAKIGKYDVVDENGNQKWDKYNDAINAAYKFLMTLNMQLTK